MDAQEIWLREETGNYLERRRFRASHHSLLFCGISPIYRIIILLCQAREQVAWY